MKLKVNDAGMPIQLASPSKSTSNVQSSKTDLHLSETELSHGVSLLWSCLNLCLAVGLILVATLLTLCDIIDLEIDAKLKLINLPEDVQLTLTDSIPRFLVAVIGFMLSVSILVLERNVRYQQLDAVISLLWVSAQLSHLPEISHHFALSELFIFKCIISAIISCLSFILFITHMFTCLRLFYLQDVHKPRDVSSINPSHKELVQSFKENMMIVPFSPSPSPLPEVPREQMHCSKNQQYQVVPVSPCRNLIINPDSALRKRLASLSIDKEMEVKHCAAEEQSFNKLLEKLGTDLKSNRKNISFEEVNHETNWITSGFWSTRCYGSDMNKKESDSRSSVFTSFSASWSKFITDEISTDIMSNFTQKVIRIRNKGTKSKGEALESKEALSLEGIVQPSKLNILPQISPK